MGGHSPPPPPDPPGVTFRVALVVGGRLTCEQTRLLPQVRRYLAEHPTHLVDVAFALNDAPESRAGYAARPGMDGAFVASLECSVFCVEPRHENWHNKNASHANSVRNTLSMFRNGKRAHDRLFALGRALPYDAVVKFRPDIVADRLPEFADVVAHDEVDAMVVHVPNHSSWGGANDQVAVGCPAAMARYFALHDRLDEHLEKGCRLHPETLLQFHLNAEGIRVATFNYGYSLDPSRGL